MKMKCRRIVSPLINERPDDWCPRFKNPGHVQELFDVGPPFRVVVNSQAVKNLEAERDFLATV